MEYLENDTNIDYIILNEELDGNISTEELMKQINLINKNIKVILISTATNDEEKIINVINNCLIKKEKVS